MGVSPEDVRAAYRLLLNREPENEAVLNEHARQANTFQELRDRFLNSEEFRRNNSLPRFMPLAAAPLDVDINSSPEEFAAMTRHVEVSWRHLGLTEPHWSVWISDEFKSERIASTQQRFYDSGQNYLAGLRRSAQRCGIDLASKKCCFELGTGVGRVSIWLATEFERVVTADISEPHLALARAASERFDRKNIEFRHITAIEDLISLDGFDVFTSVAVLQHNPPPIISRILRVILDRLSPGGIAYFQVPIHRDDYRFRIPEYLEAIGRQLEPGMEMHLIPQPELFRILRECSCEVLACHDDGSTLGHMISNTIFARKISR